MNLRQQRHIVATNHIVTKIIVSLLVILPASGDVTNYIQKKLHTET